MSRFIGWLKKIRRQAQIYYSNLSFQRKLLISFSLLSVLPTLLIGLFYYRYSYHSILNQRANETYSMLKYMSRSVVENVYKQSDLRLIRISQDRSVQKLLKEPWNKEDLETDVEIRAEYAKIEKIIYENTARNFIDHITIIGNNGFLATSTTGIEDNLNDILENKNFLNFQTSKSSYWKGSVVEVGNTTYKVFGRKVYSFDSAMEDRLNHEIGYLLFWVNERSVRNVFEDFKHEIDGNVFVLGGGGEVFATTTNRNYNRKNILTIFPEIEIKDIGKAQKVSDEKNNFLAITYFDSNAELYAVNTLPLSEVLEETNQLLTVNILAVIGLIILSIFISTALSRFLTIPLSRLAENMKKSDIGKVRTDFLPKYDDEVGYLGRQFNNMANKLNQQAVQIQETEKKQREAELKAFEAQIRPHFLYNTLSTAIWLINAEQNKEAISVISALAKMFRISISRGENIIPIRKELEHVKSYLEIQNVRYGGEFQVSIEHDERTSYLKTVKMILQPLVENAIYHSMLKSDNGKIVVSTQLLPDKVLLCVKDSGGKMTTEQAEQINKILCDREKIPAPIDMGIGIKNVHDRVYFTWQGETGLRYRVENGWTIAEITLPIVEE